MATELMRRAAQAHTTAGRQLTKAATLAAEACEQTARAHERLAKAQCGDVLEHRQRAEEYRTTAGTLREAAARFRTSADPQDD